MEIPIYNKSEIAYAISEGDDSLAEFEQYLDQLIADFCLDDPAMGIGKKAANEGTKGLSEKQLYTLKVGMEAYKMERCDMCSSIMAVKTEAIGPFFCDFCLEKIKESE